MKLETGSSLGESAKSHKVIGTVSLSQKIWNFAKQSSEGIKRKSSCQLYFKEGIDQFGIDRRLLENLNKETRRRIATLLLRADGAMIKRDQNSKYCIKCEKEIRCNVFVHKILSCRETEMLRKKNPEELQILRDIGAEYRLIYIQRSVLKGEKMFLKYL